MVLEMMLYSFNMVRPLMVKCTGLFGCGQTIVVRPAILGLRSVHGYVVIVGAQFSCVDVYTLKK
jgi:hypothetical protein